MARTTDPSRDLDALMAHLGWRPPADEAAEVACLLAKQGPPKRVTADKVLAAIAGKVAEAEEQPALRIVPYVNPYAEGLSRAARNGDAIPADIEARMQADKERARAERKPPT